MKPAALFIALAAVAALARPVCGQMATPPRAAAPNVFIISVDTLRADHLGCYGYPRATSPVIDRLAVEGVLFERVFAPVPRTTPSLASMMTGLYPRAHGLMTLVHTLAPERITLAEVLAARGYATAAFVPPNVAANSGLNQGFATYSVHEGKTELDPAMRAEGIASAAAAWAEAHRGAPMFVWLHLLDPHFRYRPPAPYDGQFDPAFTGTFDLYDRLDRGEVSKGQVFFQNDLTPRQLEHAVALYDGEIRYTDTAIGQYLDRLRAAGLLDGAVVVLTADHGESLGEHGYFFEHGEYLYDGTLRIPLILKLPGSNAAGRRVRGKAMIQDIMPTVLAAVGVTDLPRTTARDLRPFVDGADGEPHPVAFAETCRRFFPENPRRYIDGIPGHWKSVREGKWKLIEIPKPDQNLYELYDIDADPGETRDLHATERATAERLTALLHQWLATFEQPGAAARPPDPKLDPATVDRLRALGYMND